MRFIHTLLAATAILFTSLSMEAAPANPSEKTMKVTLQLFSGRPNPVFVIRDPYTLNKIKDLMGNLPATKSAVASQALRPALGYTGIVVEPTEAALPAIESLKVYRSNVEVRNLVTTKSAVAGAPVQEDRTDASLELERLLIQEALDQGVIDQAIVEFMNK